ncbi:hypothetical protein B0H14DRAFT_3484582 [Mycena olivaceomarginata]|nr:hypothetical protein B0H14DRAFT_3484582 [Mycena olivaceomarginata]
MERVVFPPVEPHRRYSLPEKEMDIDIDIDIEGEEVPRIHASSSSAPASIGLALAVRCVIHVSRSIDVHPPCRLHLPRRPIHVLLVLHPGDGKGEGALDAARGITLDEKLNFKMQAEAAATRGLKVLLACNRLTRSAFGLPRRHCKPRISASDVEEEENDTNEYPDSTSAQRMTIPNDENDTMIVLSPDMLGEAADALSDHDDEDDTGGGSGRRTGASSPGAAPTSSAGSMSCSRSSSCQCVLPGPLHHTRLRRTFAFSASTTQTRSRLTRPPAGDASDVKIASTFIKYVDYVALFVLIATSNTSHSGMRTLSCSSPQSTRHGSSSRSPPTISLIGFPQPEHAASHNDNDDK